MNMIEIYVKWCCDMEHVPYKKKQNNSLWQIAPTTYTTKQYKASYCNSNEDSEAEQMTIFDYTILNDVAM